MSSFKCKRCDCEFRDGAHCSVCQGWFDFPCSGITEAGYRKLGDRKHSWKCPSCKGTSSPHVPSGNSTLKSPVPANLESIALDLKHLSSQISSLPALVSSIKAIQSDIADLKAMKSDLADVKASMNFMQDSLETLNKRISDVNLEVQGLLKTKEKVDSLQQRFDVLESAMRDFDQRARANNIEIKGIPITQSENLYDIVTKISTCINVPIPKEQINYVARIPMRNDKHNKAILVSIHNKYIKENIVAAAKKCNIIPSNLGLSGDKRIFINDHLTLENKMLLNKTKNLAKERGYAYVWVKSCKIFVRKNDTSHVLTIKSESDLKKIS